MDSNNPPFQFDNDDFRGFASCLAQVTNLSFFLRGDALSEEGFVRALAQKDRALADKVRAWLAAAHEVSDHVRKRQDVRPNDPIVINPSGHAL